MSLDSLHVEPKRIRTAMILHIPVLFALAMPWTSRVSASPYAQLQTPPQSSSLIPLSRQNPRVQSPSNFSVPFNNIICYNSDHGRQPITVDTCRPTLTVLRQFPTYRTVQRFKENKEPRLPNTPPYVINPDGTNCAIEISARLDEIEEKFSFEQARTLATTILEDCASPGYGGQTPIGLLRNGWWVKVVGFDPDDPDIDDAGRFGALRSGHTTLVATS